MTLVAAAHLASRQGLAHAQDIKVVRHAIVADERMRLLEIADKTPVTRALKAGFTIETRLER